MFGYHNIWSLGQSMIGKQTSWFVIVNSMMRMFWVMWMGLAVWRVAIDVFLWWITIQLSAGELRLWN